MISALLFDFSRTLLFPKDKNYTKELNPLHAELSKRPQYNFLDHFELNSELMRFLKKIKKRYELYIFTTGSIQNAPEIQSELKETFVKIYAAEKLGLNKKEPSAYQYIAADLDRKPSEVLFIDDSIINIKAAQAAGMETLHYISIQDILIRLNQILF